MKITRKYITALFMTAVLTSVPAWIPVSYGETKKSDDGKYTASVQTHRFGALGLFNRFDRVTFKLANTDETIILTKEFSSGELDDPSKIVDRRNAFVHWNGRSVKISDAWNRSVVWKAE